MPKRYISIYEVGSEAVTKNLMNLLIPKRFFQKKMEKRGQGFRRVIMTRRALRQAQVKLPKRYVN